MQKMKQTAKQLMTERQEMLEEMLKIVHDMFITAEKEGLYVGIGKDSRLPDSKQEGPKVKRLHKLHDNLWNDANS
jgi:predicted ribosome-associated RNA-binding protein Tma20